MSSEHKKCCKDCKNGQLGKNEVCKAKLMVGQLSKQAKNATNLSKNKEV